MEISSLKEKINEVINDSQKKFQRVDFELQSLRGDMKEMTDKNSSFKGDIMTAIREIKEICRSNSTSINKISDDMSIIKEDLVTRIEIVHKQNEEAFRQIQENSMEVSH